MERAITRTTFVLLVIFCFLPAAAFAAGEGPVTVGRIVVDTNGQSAALQLDDVQISAMIENNLAVTTVEHTFRNQFNGAVDGTFCCVIPEGAILFRFALGTGDGPHNDAQVVPIENEADTYEAIFGHGIFLPASVAADPVLNYYARKPDPVRLAGPQAFQASINKIQPGEVRRVLLAFVQPVAMQGNEFRYTLPLRMREKAGRFALKAEVKTTEQLANISTTDMGAEDYAANSDYVLTWKLREAPPVVSCSYFPETDTTGYFAVVVTPRSPEKPRPSQVLFMVEQQMLKSGEARKLIAAVLEKMNPADTFNILLCDTRPQWLLADFVENIPEFRELAANQLAEATMQANNVFDAFSAAENALSADNAPAASIIYCGDGAADAGANDPAVLENRAAQLVRKNRNIRFSVVCTDNAARWQKQIATATAGSIGKTTDDRRELAERLTAKGAPQGLQLKLQNVKEKTQYVLVPRQQVKTSDPRRNAQAVAQNYLPNVAIGDQILIVGQYELLDNTPVEQARATLSSRNYGVLGQCGFSRIEPATDYARHLKAAWVSVHTEHVLPVLKFLDDANFQYLLRLSSETGVLTPFTFYTFPSKKAEPNVDERFQIDFWADRAAGPAGEFAPYPSSTGSANERDQVLASAISTDIDAYLENLTKENAGAFTPAVAACNPDRSPKTPKAFSPLSMRLPELVSTKHRRYPWRSASSYSSPALYTDLLYSVPDTADPSPEVLDVVRCFAYGPKQFSLRLTERRVDEPVTITRDGEFSYCWHQPENYCARWKTDSQITSYFAARVHDVLFCV